MGDVKSAVTEIRARGQLTLPKKIREMSHSLQQRKCRSSAAIFQERTFRSLFQQ